MKLTGIIWICTGVLIFGVGKNVIADVNIVSMYLGDRLQTYQAEGLYGELLVEILPVEIPVNKVTIMPFRRMLLHLHEGQAQCVWALDPAILKESGISTDDMIKSKSLFDSTQHLFTLRETGEVLNLDSLSNKLVAIQNGSNFEEALESAGADLIRVSGQMEKLKMLAENRVDALLGWAPDMLILAAELGISLLYDPSVVTNRSEVGMVCRKSEETIRFIQQLNSNISNFKISGRLESTFDHYGYQNLLFR